MSHLLNSGGKLSNTMFANLKAQRKAILDNWESTGLLDGLHGHVKEDIAQLYESEASYLLNSNTPKSTQEMIDYHRMKYSVSSMKSQIQDAAFHIMRLIYYIEKRIREKHCE